MSDNLHDWNWPLVIAAALFAAGLFASLYLINHVGVAGTGLGIYE